jgi:PAS domain-containing protein
VLDLIYFKDRASRFTLANLAHAAYFGITSPAELTGKSDFDFYESERAGSLCHGADDHGEWPASDRRYRRCDTGQGYFISRPVSAAALERWLSSSTGSFQPTRVGPDTSSVAGGPEASGTGRGHVAPAKS